MIFVGLLFLSLSFSLAQIPESKNEILCTRALEGYEEMINSMFLDVTCFIDGQTIENSNTIVKSDDSLGIKKIFVINGDIKYLPINLSSSFPHLESFSSSKGKFDKITKENFKDLTTLESLDLLSGELKLIEVNSFDDLISLTVLNIADNKIEYIYSKTFKNLINLSRLDLSGNKIEILHPKSFENLRNLKVLLLAGNKLSTLDRNLFVDKPKLEEIHAEKNDFIHIDEFAFDGLSLKVLNIFSEACRVGKYEGNFTISEIKEDLRDICKESDFIVTEIHAKMIEFIRKNGDESEIY